MEKWTKAFFYKEHIATRAHFQFYTSVILVLQKYDVSLSQIIAVTE